MARQVFYLVGPGAVGKVLSRRLVRAGWVCAGVCGQGSVQGRRLAKELGAPYADSVETIEFARGVMLLTVFTNRIAPLAAELARRKLDWKRIAVIHTSGALDAKVLAPVKKRGATVAACHPFMTFPRFGGSVKAGSNEDLTEPGVPVVYGLDGDEAGLRAARRLVNGLEGVPIEVRGGDRVAYHAAAVLACTLLGATVAMAEEILLKLKVPKREAHLAVASIAEQTLANFGEFGMARAWTGPQTRGDRKSVAMHLRALKRLDPEILKVYKSLSEWVLKQGAR
jgi:predicted short-subunit dehydrogenase-like oxidoreductase (DUF2520 family)